MERYTVWYRGYLFDGDKEGYNEHLFDDWNAVIQLYYNYGAMIHIIDNQYGVTFEYGEWHA